ncbi:MAG: SH3 domain-containing protein [Desulfobacterales bacterium]
MPAIRLFSLLALCLLYSGCTTLHDAADTGRAEKAAECTEKKAETDATEEKGRPSLIQAARADQTELIVRLLEQGADPEEKDGEGKTAILHAFESGNLASFKLLLEKGAVISAKEVHTKKPFADLVAEYRVYQHLLAQGEKTPVSDFETCFLQFPKGHYAAAVETLFEDMVHRDFSRMEKTSDAKSVQAFTEKYAGMGKDFYLITADSLNIRKSDSVSGQKLGTYRSGEIVRALEESGGWIRTDQGWISKKYSRQISVNIPKLQMYLDKAAEMAVSASSQIPRKSARSQKNLTVPQQEKEEKTVSGQETDISRQKETSVSDSSTVRRELDAILSHPELKSLEDFIRKYKDRAAYRSLVDLAREKYKDMLLGL